MFTESKITKSESTKSYIKSEKKPYKKNSKIIKKLHLRLEKAIGVC